MQEFVNNEARYGSPRIAESLKRTGLHVSKHRIERAMKDLGIHAVQKRRYGNTTNSKQNLPVSPNMVARDFTA